MMRFAAAALVLAILAAPVTAQDRRQVEARLDTLSEEVIADLSTALVPPDGMTCRADAQDPSAANRRVVPNWHARCFWQGIAGPEEAQLLLIASADVVRAVAAEIQAGSAGAGADAAGETRHYGTPPVGLRVPGKLLLAVAPGLAVIGDLPTGPLPDHEDAVDALAEAIAARGQGLASLPALQAHAAAMAEYRLVLEQQIAALAALLPPGPGAPDAVTASRSQSDIQFFGLQPLVQREITEAGVTMTLTLTSSPFALEAALEEFKGAGRVQSLVSDRSLTALIDMRVVLSLDITAAAPEADPAAAMQSVLDRIAANDFGSY